ncbi:unnamed protein product [Nezara viridula]|uniref:T-complex protein 1 subunit theta n=1 Tax=Nezara viridula TaxID=85310 RepID=A0A9P0MSR5_NEZVI|nr:unnamed protein product [Nezara viridula]
MALHVPKAPGFSQMLKEGARHFSGLEEAVFRNIAACKEFVNTIKTAYGPYGMNKIIINHIDKLFVTNDAATIVKELEIEHPAAKVLVLASNMQEEEVGDGTNFVLILAGTLLEEALPLLKMGMTPADIIEGYELALKKALEVLKTLTCEEIKDPRDEAAVLKAVRSSVMSKQFGYEDFLGNLITKACISILPEETTFNVDNVRIQKISGSSILSSETVLGMVFKRGVEGEITKMSGAKVVVYTCPFDIATTETKGTVLIKTAAELHSFSSGEESQLESQITAIKNAGVNVVVAGGKISDIALHFLNKAGLMAVRLQSKFDIRRLCKVTGAVPLPILTPPSKEELGYADSVYIDEIGDNSIVVFKLDGKESRISTIIVRGATENYMDDIERAIDDGVNTFKLITRDGHMVPGGGAVEAELAKQVRDYSETIPGLERYAAAKFAHSLTIFPKILAESSGLQARTALQQLYEGHRTPEGVNLGINIQGEDDKLIIDCHEAGILDCLSLKEWGLKFATMAACTVLRIDQIIMAKRAGGPSAKPPAQPDDD